MKPEVENIEKAKKENKKQDNGLRGNLKGELFIDRDVFFKRDDVKKLLEILRSSNAYPR